MKPTPIHKTPTPIHKTPAPYFDTRTGTYWLEVNPGKFLNLDTSQVKLHLRQSGLSKELFVGTLNELDRAMFNAQVERPVEYAGPIAGYKAGFHRSLDGKAVLVTRSSVPSPAEKGSWKEIGNFLEQLLGDPKHYLVAWLHFARRSMTSGVFKPGQMLVFAGESGCGKSLCQALITAVLGGRAGKPYRYMIGETPFNSELAASEHLMIEDENSSSDIRSRRKFGASVKDFTVNASMSVHCKGREAITLSPFRRLTLSCNSEPENMMILPPLDASIIDKIQLFKCHHAEVVPDRKALWDSFMRDLPGFCHFLDTLKVPAAMQCPRFGVVAWQDPELLASLNECSPEHRLRNLIDEVLWGEGEVRTWVGTAEELELQMRKSSFAHAVEKLLYFSSACSVYLARLASQGKGVARECKGGKPHWRITG